MEPAGSEAFELQPSIWNLIAQSCPSEEQEEVQRILGYAIVEQARDLYDEACTHLEIWNQFKNESEERTIQRFPEPPEVRARLVQEIKFLLEHLERRGQQSVRNGSKKRQQIEDYVKQQRQGQHTPSQSRPSSVASYRSQSAMAMLSDIEGRSPSLDDEAMRICEHVTVKGIDGVIQNLREALQEECEIRKQEIQFLQGCVEESSQRARKRDNTSKNPSIQDLREFGSELEKEIMEGIGSATVTGPPLVGHHRVRSSLLPPLREDLGGVIQGAPKEQGINEPLEWTCQRHLPNWSDGVGESSPLQNRFTPRSNPTCVSGGRTYLSLRVVDGCAYHRTEVLDAADNASII